MEHLFAWQRQRDTNSIESDEGIEQIIIETITSNPSPAHQKMGITKSITEEMVTTELLQEEEDKQAVSSHTHIQWLLAKIGQKLGCKIWIASNDQNRIWNGERLGDLSLKTLPPLWMDVEFQRTISLIDILWLKSAGGVVAAFEIEHTTSIYSGLLRMSDLITSFPAISFPLYIVTPHSRLDKVRHELSRPTFQALELHKRCGFFSEEKLIGQADAIMEWANHPSAIDKLAARVSDVNG